jgi:hypothetical protein
VVSARGEKARGKHPFRITLSRVVRGERDGVVAGDSPRTLGFLGPSAMELSSAAIWGFRGRPERIEAPIKARLVRMIASALRTSEDTLTAKISSRICEEVTARMWSLIPMTAISRPRRPNPATADAGGEGGPADQLGPEVWAATKSDPTTSA